jgi:murein DD-endopeptidase MepM/ murein hydrolase activator NlpD
VLVLCAGCTSSREVVPAAATGDTPLMTDSLLLKPVDRGRLSSAYGMRYNPITKRRQMHRGIDWAAPRGTAVRAAGDGVVVAAGRLGTYGHYLRIDHGGRVATAYAHLDGYTRGLRPGRRVPRADLNPQVASPGRPTAPHLHSQIRIVARQVDPLAGAALAAARQPDPSLRVTQAGFRSAPGQGPLTTDPGAGGRSVPDGAPTLILIEDLLRR